MRRSGYVSVDERTNLLRRERLSIPKATRPEPGLAAGEPLSPQTPLPERAAAIPVEEVPMP
jgi:hypothetical protein